MEGKGICCGFAPEEARTDKQKDSANKKLATVRGSGGKIERIMIRDVITP